MFEGECIRIGYTYVRAWVRIRTCTSARVHVCVWVDVYVGLAGNPAFFVQM